VAIALVDFRSARQVPLPHHLEKGPGVARRQIALLGAPLLASDGDVVQPLLRRSNSSGSSSPSSSGIEFASSRRWSDHRYVRELSDPMVIAVVAGGGTWSSCG
jgi:hypothetical protein